MWALVEVWVGKTLQWYRCRKRAPSRTLQALQGMKFGDVGALIGTNEGWKHPRSHNMEGKEKTLSLVCGVWFFFCPKVPALLYYIT